MSSSQASISRAHSKRLPTLHQAPRILVHSSYGNFLSLADNWNHVTMPNLSQQDRPKLAEYLDLLKSQWSLPVACQNECHPPNSCQCLRHVIHIAELKRWWKGSLQQVLHEMGIKSPQIFPVEPSLFSGEDSCLSVYSLLLKQDRGHLIERFYQCGMTDKRLEMISSVVDETRLRDDLTEVVSRDEVDRITTDFQRERWAYCPLELRLNMDRHLQSTKIIPPFCQKIKLGEKGGTASIYWVTVQENYISDQGLKDAVEKSLYYDTEYKWVSK